MTDVTLPHPRDEARHVVKAAFERTGSITSYQVLEGGDVIVGYTEGGLLNLGEEIVVGLSRPDTDGRSEARTIAAVTAGSKRAINPGGNPWKHKTAVIEQLHALKGTPVEDLHLSDDADSGAPGGETRDDGTPRADGRDDAIGSGDEVADDATASGADEAVDTPDAMILGAKFMLLVFVGLLSLMLLLALVATLL